MKLLQAHSLKTHNPTMTHQDFSIPPPNLFFAWILLIIAFLMILGLLFSCTERPNNQKEIRRDGFVLVEIDGCQYIEVRYAMGFTNGYYSLTHKGNCPNPIHCYNLNPSE